MAVISRVQVEDPSGRAHILNFSYRSTMNNDYLVVDLNWVDLVRLVEGMRGKIFATNEREGEKECL